MKIAALLVCALPFTVSCVDMKWQRYDDSQYAIALAPTDEVYRKHTEVLASWQKQGPMPPGLAAELGYYYALTGRPSEAEQCYAAEVSSHPELTVFVEVLRRFTLESPASKQAESPTNSPEVEAKKVSP